MKILNVNMSLDPVTGGGTAERTFQISKYLVKAGVKCSILTTDIGLDEKRKKSLGGVHLISLPCLFERFYFPKSSYRIIKDIVAKADIVHLMNHWTILNAIVYQACRQLKKPYVVCPAGALPIFGRSRFIKKAYNTLVGNRLIKNAWGHVAIPDDEICHFQSYGIAPDKVTVIPNGIAIEDFNSNDVGKFREKYNLSDHPIILFLGRLNPIKGPDLILEAFALAKDDLPFHHLVFAGPDGGMRNELGRLTEQFGLGDRVHFLDYLGGADKSQAYHAAELLVIPSRQEAMSIVVLEAAITGTPVLITDQCGFDQVEDVRGGMVVKPSAEALCKGLMQMLSNNEKLKNMGLNLQKYVQANFTWESVAEKYLFLYNTILSETHP